MNGRYWIRTSDPFRVKEVRYRCANRPHLVILDHGGAFDPGGPLIGDDGHRLGSAP